MLRRNYKRKIAGILLLFLGFVFMCLTVWLFTKTLGTTLLFTDARVGRFAKYYWIFLIAAVASLIAGLVLVKRKEKRTKKTETQQTKTGLNTAITDERKAVIGVVDERKTDVAVADEEETDITQSAEARLENAVSSEPKTRQNFCPQCGKPVKEGTVFCIYCGKRLTE